jgi:SAM-dependent methyltransferase
MGMIGIFKDSVNRLARRRGYAFTDLESLYEWQRQDEPPPANRLPPDPYLVETNPRLVELMDRYSKFDSRVTAPTLWRVDHISGERLRYPRGDDAYVWQLRGPNMNVLGYALTTYYVKAMDTLGLLDRLSDDGAFGNFIFQLAGRGVSRDVLDSVIELYFLERNLKLSEMANPTILDIGAGYGRLAHRTCQAMSNVGAYFCVDAVPQSTFISEHYLKFRKSKAQVVALDEIEELVKRQRPDLALNIHSFSECRIEAVEWWINLLEKSGVKHLMIAPNDFRHDGGQALLTNEGHDFEPLLKKHNYKLIVRQPKYLDPVVQTYGINPTHHYLFALT